MAETGEAVTAHQDGLMSIATDSACAMEVEEASNVEAGVKTEVQKDKAEYERNEQGDGCQPLGKTQTKAIADEPVKGDVVGEPVGAPSLADAPGSSCGPTCNGDVITQVTDVPVSVQDGKNLVDSRNPSSNDTISKDSARCSVGPEVSQGSSNIHVSTKDSQGSYSSKVSPEVLPESSSNDVITKISQLSSSDSLCTQISQSSSENTSNNDAILKLAEGSSNSDVCTLISTSSSSSQVSTKVSEKSAAGQSGKPSSSNSVSQGSATKTETLQGSAYLGVGNNAKEPAITDGRELCDTVVPEEQELPKTEERIKDTELGNAVTKGGGEVGQKDGRQDGEGKVKELDGNTFGQSLPDPLDDSCSPKKVELNSSLADGSSVADAGTKPTQISSSSKSSENDPGTEKQLTEPEPADLSVSALPDAKDQGKSKDDDKVNNNTKKHQSFCESDKGSNPSIPDGASATTEAETPEKAHGDEVDDGKMMEVPQPESNKKPDQSVLMQYLGLQPVKAVEKSPGSQGCENKQATSGKPKLGLGFLDPFSTMPRLDLMDPYERIYSSPYTLPFEVCSEGSRSPEPPLLAETPVVGSSPPRHDYDAMEAKMINMTPRGTSPTDTGVYLAAMPGIYQTDQHAKSAFLIRKSGDDEHLEKQSKKMKFLNKSLLDRSEEVQTTAIFPQDIPCPRCNRTFKSRSQLRGHLRWHINDPINLLSGRWQTEKGSSDDTKSSDKDSIPLFEKMGHRSNLQMSSTRGNQGKVSQKSFLKEDTFCCSFCPKKFQTSLKLRGHMIVHKRKPSKAGSLLRKKAIITHSSESSFRCEVCSKVFDAKLKLRGHMISHSKEAHGGKQKYAVGVKKSYKCEVCFKSFPSVRARNGHQGIHSVKWQQGNNIHLKEMPSELLQGDLKDKTEARKGSFEQGMEATAMKRNRVFKCHKCSLVFATKHRVRKHLFKVHSEVSPSISSFTEENVDGCRFCEVFKKRKRGRPKRGENTLMTCVHGKSVIGYNLPVSVIKSLRKTKMSRMKKGAPRKSKKSKEDEIISEKVMQSNIATIEHNSDTTPIQEGEVVQGSSLPGTLVQNEKRRGRPPKKQSNSVVRLGAKRSPIYHSNGVKTRLGRGGIRSGSVSFRKHGQSRRLTFLGRHMKSGWDSKKQRFIGRPYKCHLCKMSYRSERQLCSHMRTHGIHVFDLSQLPVDQRGDGPRLDELDCTSSEDVAEMELHDADHDLNEPVPDSSAADSSSTRKSSESGVGGTCSVCTKEFDSDNMFHQHLLGRFNKKCRQEWMKHTFGFGMRNKVTVSPRQGMFDEDASQQSPEDERCHGVSKEAADKSSGNLCVIDKISMGSLPGTGVFSNLQPKNNKTTTEQVETSLQNNSICTTENVKTDVQQLFKLGTCVPQVDTVTQVLPSPKKGAVLNAVINRLTQSTKSSESSSGDQDMTVSTESSTLSASKHHASGKLHFKCDHCAKTFDKRQKLCVHTRIHKPKIATVMDHIEHATQQSISATPSTSSCEKAEGKDHEGDEALLSGVAVSDNQLDKKTSNALQVPELHLTYACTECPKHFASNMKLANHLKMHMKSTKAKPKALHNSSEKSALAQVNVLGANMKQDTKKENPSQITNEDKADTLDGTLSSSPQDIEEDHMIETDVSMEVIGLDQGHQAVSAESHPSEIQGPGKEEASVNNATGNMSGPQSIPARPRLLLKINPSKLQCLYSCEDCSKSFKSRRQLAHHRRLHEAAKTDSEQQSDREKNSPSNDHEACPEKTPIVTTASETIDPQNEPSVGQSVPVEDHYPTVGVHKDTVPCLNKTAKCKICDKIVQKGQLDDHMISHTKGLHTRSFDCYDNKDNGWQLQESASSSELTMQVSSRQLTSGSESDKFGGIHDKTKYFPAESDPATDNVMEGGILDITRDQISHSAAQNEISISISGSPSMPLKQLTCNVCSTTCENFQQLFEHQKSHSVSSVNMPQPSALNAAQLAPEEVIKNQHSLGEKLNRPRIYPCELCGFAFSSFRQFRGHISQTHGGKFQYRLMLQQKEAVQTGAFEPETDTLTKTHPHKCDLCGRRFKRLALLMFHLNKLHKGWKQRLCMSNARSKSRVPQMAAQRSAGGSNAGHMAGTVTAPGDLPFTCELCGKSFRMKVQLCGHMKTHGRVGHSPIKISPMKLKGKYTLRKRGKPDFRLSDDWILDMDDEHMASDKSVMQQIPTRTDISENSSMNHPMDGRYYAPMYSSQFADPRPNPEQTISRMTQPRPHYETSVSVQNTPLGSPNLPMRKSPISSTGIPMQKSPIGAAGVPMKSPLGSAGVPMKSPLGAAGVPMKSPIGSAAFDLKVPKAPPPPDPCKFITIQLEPVSQQMLHRCLLCHSYFSSQENAVFHCKEVHFKKKPPRYPPAGMMAQGTSRPPDQSLSPVNQSMPNVTQPTHLQGVMKPSTLSQAPHPLTKTQDCVPSSYGRVINPPHRGVASAQVGGVTSPLRRGVSSPPFRGVAHQSLRGVSSPPVRGVANLPLKGVASQPLRAGASPHLGGVTKLPLGGSTSARMERVASHQLGGVTSPHLARVTSPQLGGASSPPLHPQYQSSSQQSSPFQPAETLPKPPSVSTGKMISQTPFNEMLYRVETSEGQTRYVCNTCKSTFLHYNFLMSHLAEHNHLAYTCLQCGYATYSEKDYQLHCQLHDGQISKNARRMRPKSQDNEAKQESKTSGPFPRAVATCHICQRSFVNLKGLQAHMVLHSAKFSSISERRNESKKVPNQIKSMVRPVPSDIKDNRGPSHLGSVSEQTEALDLSCKQVTTGTDSSMEEVLDLSMGSRSFTQELTDPVQDVVAKQVIKPVETLATSLPDVCQVLQNAEQLKEPSPSPSGKLIPSVRKPKNSIRLVGAIDVDVASLENKYSIVTDLMDADSDISPDLPPSNNDTTSGEGDGETSTDHSKSPKRLRPYKCSMCQYATDFKDSMDRHEQKHRKFRTLACHQCSYRTPEKRLMLRHVLTIHEKQKPYQCKLCSYSSAYKHHLKRHHTKRHQDPLLTCTQCEFTTEDAPKLEEHCATHQEPQTKVYNCKFCSLVFDTGKLLKAHKHTVHKKKKKSKKGVINENNSSSSIEGASESTESKEQDTPLPETEEPASLKHQCKLCIYQTNDQNELTKHLMKNHFGNQAKEGLGDVCTTAQCPQCGYLTGKDQMKAHMQIHDSGEEFFDCEQCTFKAESQEELDKHVQQKHKVKATAKLMCKMCGMHFWDADDMKLHTEVHLRDSSISVKNPFICSLCPLKLMNRRDALRHLQLHTDRYPFKCRHCVFSCFTKASIQRHLTIHKHAGKSKPVATRKNSRKSLSGVSCGNEDSLPVDDGARVWRKGQSTTC